MPEPHTDNSQADGDISSWGLALYDEMMAEIEPDLVSSAIDGLTEKYKDETDEQAADRADRYNAAYETFNARMMERRKEWDDMMHALKRKAFASLEKDDHEKEMSEGIADLDQQLASL
jgi:hypothetical protein